MLFIPKFKDQVLQKSGYIYKILLTPKKRIPIMTAESHDDAGFDT
jgi:hypothetical protein